MLTNEENALLTATGKGTPAGTLLRSYWQPVALADELPLDGDPLPVRILGEDLVLFRDDQGRPGLVGLKCPHRGVDLSYGRVENNGLRCLYHGWLFDVGGRCLEQPGEPTASDYHRKIRHLAYPCQDVAGIVFAYMGDGEPPVLPAYEALLAPAAHLMPRKFIAECNYLQALEGVLDPAHTSFLHRQFDGADSAYRTEHKITNTGFVASTNDLFTVDMSPTIEMRDTAFGVRIFAIRRSGDGRQFLRVSNYVFPNVAVAPGSTAADGYTIGWFVPIDDTSHYKYQVGFKRSAPFERRVYDEQYAEESAPGFRLRRNRENRYLQNRDEMKTHGFTGMGGYFAVHDQFAIETQGSIQDRSQEHLGYTDRAIIASRRALQRAIADVVAGRQPPHRLTEPLPPAFDEPHVLSLAVPESEEWEPFFERYLRERVGAKGQTAAR